MKRALTRLLLPLLLMTPLTPAARADDVDEQVDALYQQAKADDTAGHFAPAIEKLTKVIALCPTHEEALFSRACLFERQEKFQQAIGDFTRAIAVSHTASGQTDSDFLYACYTARAKADTVLHRNAAALADDTEAIRLKPHLPEAYWYRGQVYRTKRNYAMTAADFTAALREDPKCIDAYQERGETWLLAGRWDQAAADLTAYLPLTASSAPIYAERAFAFFNQGAQKPGRSLDLALKDLNEAVLLDPTNANYLTMRGILMEANQQAELAIADYDQAIKTDPYNAITHSLRGALLGKQGNKSRALQDLNIAIRLDPKDPAPYHTRALLYQQSGEKGKAKQDLRAVKTLTRPFNDGSTNAALTRLLCLQPL